MGNQSLTTRRIRCPPLSAGTVPFFPAETKRRSAVAGVRWSDCSAEASLPVAFPAWQSRVFVAKTFKLTDQPLIGDMPSEPTSHGLGKDELDLIIGYGRVDKGRLSGHSFGYLHINPIAIGRKADQDFHPNAIVCLLNIVHVAENACYLDLFIQPVGERRKAHETRQNSYGSR